MKVVTAADLLGVPDDGNRHELIRGQHRVVPALAGEHGRVALAVGRLLVEHVTENECGVAFAPGPGFILARDPDTVRVPDVAFVTRARVDPAGLVTGQWSGAPDLVVEVMADEITFTELQDMALEWIGAGTQAVMMLNPERRRATVWRPGGDAATFQQQTLVELGDVVSGWRPPVLELFA
jgi:Uma2 family endonuclease